MSNNIVSDVTKMMNDKEQIQNDLQEAMQLVNNIFKEKYISRIHNAVDEQLKNSQNTPTREIALLNALKPYMPEENKVSIEKVINFCTLMQTANSIQSELNVYNTEQMKAASTDSSTIIQSDGIYEFDDTCLKKNNQGTDNVSGLMFMMALTGMI